MAEKSNNTVLITVRHMQSVLQCGKPYIADVYMFTTMTMNFINVSDIEEVQALKFHIFLRISVF